MTVTARHYKSWGNESWKGTPEEESLQASLENRHRGVRTWCVEADCSKCRQQQRGRPDRRQSDKCASTICSHLQGSKASQLWMLQSQNTVPWDCVNHRLLFQWNCNICLLILLLPSLSLITFYILIMLWSFLMCKANNLPTGTLQ